ncbi:MAG TPA: hypothetical protein VN786_13415 [Acidimicrobiales bacterium]|nr:hypothetical protein [Acidimicrobiales bacterium]
MPQFQRSVEPVAGLGVPALGYGYLSEMDEPDRGPGTAASEAGSLVEPRTHVENILASLSERRPPSTRVAVQAQVRLEVPPEDQSAEVLQLPAAAPQPEAWPQVQFEDRPQPQAPGAGAALRPAAAAAAAAAASAAGPRPAPPAGPSVTPPMPLGSGTPSTGTLSNAILPRSPGAAAAARALAALAPSHTGPAGPARPVGTGAQSEPLLSSAAASSAARALTSLAGASARASSMRATPAANGPMRVTPATADGPDVDAPSFSPPPRTDDEASGGPGPVAVDSEVPQADPQLDDILPAKSKSFFRLRR